MLFRSVEARKQITVAVIDNSSAVKAADFFYFKKKYLGLVRCEDARQSPVHLRSRISSPPLHKGRCQSSARRFSRDDISAFAVRDVPCPCLLAPNEQAFFIFNQKGEVRGNRFNARFDRPEFSAFPIGYHIAALSTRRQVNPPSYLSFD